MSNTSVGQQGDDNSHVNPRYLIIGGAPKAATTSLFRYLADHPHVCPANRKETYFFAREFDYKQVCQVPLALDAFEAYFSHCRSNKHLRIEATPYTLYAKDAADKLSKLLETSSILFILRDPVERLYSDFRFHRQREHSSVKATFEEFVYEQLQHKSNVPSLLKLGCYIEYLRPFYNVYRPESISVIFFEEFRDDSRRALRRICSWIGLDPAFYSMYQFEGHNPTITVRYATLNRASIRMESVVSALRKHIIHYSALHTPFEKMVSMAKTIYGKANSLPEPSQEPISDSLWETLVAYYRPYNQALSQMLGRRLPWKSC